MTRPNVAAFILSYGRPNRVHTFNTLIRAGFSNTIYVIVGSDDPHLDEYRQNFQDNLLVFDKDEVADRVDLADNLDGRQTPIFAREKCWDFAQDLGLDYFLMLDDDYSMIAHRRDHNGDFLNGSWPVKDLDAITYAFMRYMENAPQITSLAFAQGGDYIGGEEARLAQAIMSKRKAMNFFICKTDRHFSFPGRMNDDVTGYVVQGHRGDIFLTYGPLQITQEMTQQNEGGITETYISLGTYTKSFYTVMQRPNCVTIRVMGTSNPRIHHHVKWNRAVPKILPEEYRKDR